MEVSTPQSSLVPSGSFPSLNDSNLAANSDALVIASLTDDGDAAAVSLDFGEIYKGLTVGAKQLIDKLNEVLGEKLPGGIQSLKPEEVTPDATATRIVQGIASLFDVFARQNPDLDADELVSKFMEQARKGVEQGYGDAVGTLEALGAFEFEGVKDGISETKALIEQKLQSFERMKREELGLEVAEESAEATKTSVLAQAGGRTLSLAA